MLNETPNQCCYREIAWNYLKKPIENCTTRCLIASYRPVTEKARKALQSNFALFRSGGRNATKPLYTRKNQKTKCWLRQ